MKHTPGPWKVGKIFDGGECDVLDAKGFEICSIDATAIKENHGRKHWSEAPGESYIERGEEELIPNARLIAAAPELLSELKRMVTYYESSEERPEAVAKIKNARAAIAKAEAK